MNITEMNTQAPSRPSKVLHLSYNTAGEVTDIKETQIVPRGMDDMPYEPFAGLRETVDHRGNKIKISLREAALTNPDAANILRQDIRMVAFTALNVMPRSFAGLADFVSSDSPEESYLRDAAIGVLTPAPSGTPAPRVKSGFEGDSNIPNVLYRAIVEILGDWVRYDKIGKIRQLAQEMGLSGRLTEEAVVWNYLTTTGNYTRNNTTGDNDIGANTQTVTFSADGLRTAKAIITTAKDRKSGAYLGYMPDTLFGAPQLEVPFLQLLTSPELQRASANNAAEAIGTGTRNPFVGMIRKIVLSPWIGSSYQWGLCDSTRGAFKFQTVENFNVYQQSANPIDSEAWRTLDVLEYLVRGIFGVGFTDDRAFFYSDSSTDATVS